MHPAPHALVEHVLGFESAEVEGHVASCASCAAALVDVVEALGAYPMALGLEGASGGLRRRVMASAREQHADKAAKLFDLDRETTLRLFESAEGEAGWGEAPVPWMKLFHLDGGPATAGQDCGFVRMERGTEFPRHEHLGQENVLILQGTLHDGDGSVGRPGDLIVKPPGSVHHYSAGPNADLVFAIVIRGGIQIVTTPASPA